MRIYKRISEAEADIIAKRRGVSKTTFNRAGSASSYRICLKKEELQLLKRDVKEFEQQEQQVNFADTVLAKNRENRVVREKKQLSDHLLKQESKIEELQRALDIRSLASVADVYELRFDKVQTSKNTVAIALLSDIHFEETVKPENMVGLNAYSPEIAKKRLENYFINLIKLLNHHKKNYEIRTLVLALLGDLIGGWIHDELKQTNSLSPIIALKDLQAILISGFKYLNDNLDVDAIKVPCVIGNHGRTTQKRQFSNAVETSYEYYLYCNLAEICKLMGFSKFEFIIPTSPILIMEIYGNKYLFGHGDHFRYQGGIGGIFIPMLKWFSNAVKLFGIKKAFIGNWHTTINIKEVAVNGSVKGYDSYAMGLFLPYEEPQQSLLLLNEKRGFTNHQSIFLD